jgi:hypothetical protein
MDWHKNQRKYITKDNWSSFSYLILRCTHEDGRCGGLSDRLTPLPFLFLLSKLSNRILLIRWTRPAAIEKFLLPTAEGINWTVPEWMIPEIESSPRSIYAHKVSRFEERIQKDQMKLAEIRIQDPHGAAHVYGDLLNRTFPEDLIGDYSYEAIFHDLFRVTFEPVSAIQQEVVKQMNDMGLIPGNYAVAQYRAFYAIEHNKEKRARDQLASHAINSVQCASQLRPAGPVYFASDSRLAVETVQKYANDTGRNVVALDGTEALHLDKADGHNASEIYSIFVDVFIMGSGRCVSFGQGGLGRFVKLLGYNATCFSRHYYRGGAQRCQWKDSL